MKKDKKLKIAIIQPSIGNVLAGAELVAVELARGLQEYTDVTVLCEKKISPIENLCHEIPLYNRNKIIKTKNPIIKLLEAVLTKVADNPVIALEYIAGMLPVFFHLLFNKYDVLFPHNNWGGLIVCSIIRILKGTPILYVEHGSHLPKCWQRNVKFKPNRYIALTKHFEQEIKDNYPEINVKYVPNGVNTDKFRPDAEKVETGLTRPIILAVGRNDEIKRLNLVIEAASKIENSSLMIVSIGEGLDKLEQKGIELMGEDRFRLYRNVPFVDVHKYFAACDVFTLPSDSEAFGLVYAEAMACNKPCVAPNDEIRSEVIGPAGVLYNLGDFDGYVGALRQAVSKDWGDIPFQQSRNFDWKKISKQYFEIIQEMV